MELYLHYPICIPVVHKENFTLLLRKQVKNFKYLACETSYENENRFSTPLAKFAQILGILNNTLHQLWSRKYIMHWLSHVLLYGSEI